MTKPRILVLYHKLKEYRTRVTVDEHLYAFRKYVNYVDFHYFNAAGGIPGYLRYIDYDGIIFHYTILSNRWNTVYYRRWKITAKNLGKLNGYKVAIPQDEYAETDTLCEMLKEYGVETVFTCFSERDFDKVYPSSKVPLKHRITVLTGYIDEDAVQRIEKLCRTPNRKRSIDIGYRARKPPFWLGRHATQKFQVGEVVDQYAGKHKLKADISNDPEDVFLGLDWYGFLCSCRVVLGCEGGASLLDSTGNVRRKVEKYVSDNPGAEFNEVEAACFPGKDNNIQLFAISPRHFECAITRTCQALMQGQYAGIFKPGIHYIEINRDFSNLGDVLDKISDRNYCEEIADNAYRDIVLSEKYTYRAFANLIVSHILENSPPRQSSTTVNRIFGDILGVYLRLREWLEPLLVKYFYVWSAVKYYRLGILKEIWKRTWRT